LLCAAGACQRVAVNATAIAQGRRNFMWKTLF
jgi:hypothetical protein